MLWFRTLAIRFNDYNKKVGLYETQSELGNLDTAERDYLLFAIKVLGLAFGLGFTRRALDLRRDWDRA
jgi:hypothetical protein